MLRGPLKWDENNGKGCYFDVGITNSHLGEKVDSYILYLNTKISSEYKLFSKGWHIWHMKIINLDLTNGTDLTQCLTHSKFSIKMLTALITIINIIWHTLVLFLLIKGQNKLLTSHEERGCRKSNFMGNLKNYLHSLVFPSFSINLCLDTNIETVIC